MGKTIIKPKSEQLKSVVCCIVDYVNNYDGDLSDVFKELQLNLILLSYGLPTIDLVKTIDKFKVLKESK